MGNDSKGFSKIRREINYHYLIRSMKEKVMVRGKITVTNQSGLHLRPSILLSKTASGLKSNIKIIFGKKVIDPKSLLILLSSGITKGSEITITCDGKTEEADLQVLLDTIAGGLGE